MRISKKKFDGKKVANSVVTDDETFKSIMEVIEGIDKVLEHLGIELIVVKDGKKLQVSAGRIDETDKN